jgi:hypothetical protein
MQINIFDKFIFKHKNRTCFMLRQSNRSESESMIHMLPNYYDNALNASPMRYHARRACHGHRKPERKLEDRKARCLSLVTLQSLASFDSMHFPNKNAKTRAGKHLAQMWQRAGVLWVGSTCNEENDDHHRAQHQRPEIQHKLRRRLLTSITARAR